GQPLSTVTSRSPGDNSRRLSGETYQARRLRMALADGPPISPRSRRFDHSAEPSPVGPAPTLLRHSGCAALLRVHCACWVGVPLRAPIPVPVHTVALCSATASLAYSVTRFDRAIRKGTAGAGLHARPFVTGDTARRHARDRTA